MKIEEKTDVKIEIEQIKNLKAVFYMDLSSSQSNKMVVIPALMIVYGNEKVLCLSVHDKYFEAFYQKVRSVYLKELNEVMEDSRTDPFCLHRKIKIDDLTKRVLEQGNIDMIDKVYREYNKENAYEDSLFFHEDKIKPIIPILKYHIIKVLSLLDKVVTGNEENFRLFHNYLSFYFNIDGNPTLIPILMDEVRNNEVIFKVLGLFQERIVTNIKVAFMDDGIKIDIIIDEMNFLDSYNYHVKDKKFVLEHETYLRGELKILENVDMPKTVNENSHLITGDYEWYKFPWEALYGIIENENLLNLNERITHSQNVYMEVKDDSFLIMEFISKCFQRLSTKALIMEDLIIDSVSSKKIGLKCDDGYIIETSFNSRGMNGYYKEHLGGKYYYCLVRGSNIQEIDLNNMIIINHGCEIFYKTDLLKKSKIKKLMSGVK